MVVLGVALVALGVVLFIVEAHVPTAGVLGAGAVASIVAGAVMLVAGAGAGAVVVAGVALAVAAIALTASLLAARRILAARRAHAHMGPEALVGHVGVVRSAHGDMARVFIDGALWRAQPLWLESDSAEQLCEGDQVVVERVKGLTLGVRKADEWEVLP
jgi:membrane-bound ClpP family serine protease